MDRQRSPSHPSLSLAEAIDMVGKVHRANRTNVISRETAAKDMGYTGLTGRSLTVLASLAQYGLVEKAGKGDIKVTRRAVEILHPIEDLHRTEAIAEAANAPALFRTLHERFPEGVPSENALRSFLVQKDFNDGAIKQAISAFIETLTFAENAKESGRIGPVAALPQESTQAPKSEDPVSPSIERPQAPVGAALSFGEGELNKINMNIQGDRVAINAVLDLKGIRALEKKIATLKLLLAADEDEDILNVL